MTVEERIVKLERQNRNMRVFLVVAALGGLVTLYLFRTGPAVAARVMVLEDENGKSRAGLGAGKDGRPMLDLRDENGKLRAKLFVDEEGPVLGLWDENAKPRASLGVGKDGPGLGLLGENGKTIWKAP